ncbi:non-specific serine/threonine protein kinase [Entamoeba marina]
MQYFSLLLNSAKNLFKPSNDQTISKARYVFIDEVYKANYSSIYHCVLRESRQEVCVKMYKSKKYCKAEREQMEKEIASEISILRKLNHPSILRCFNIFLTSHKAVLETEYMKGGDMYDYLIENGYQTEENVVIIMRQLMSALYYLHQLQIVHRDIKLENILIENPNDISCIKLTDFGLSIELEESTLLTEQVGTSYYMSPELYRKLPYGKR